MEAGVATEAECDAIAEHVKELIFKSFKRAIDDSVSPRMDLHAEPDAIANMMFSNGHVEKCLRRAARCADAHGARTRACRPLPRKSAII